jgi:hypothetical protein
MDEIEGRSMNERTLVALEADDSYFNEWLLDLYSLERSACDRWNEKLWLGVQPTYASILVRSN